MLRYLLLAMLLITSGIARANDDEIDTNEYQLLRFGADWCTSCRIQHYAFDEGRLAQRLQELRIRDWFVDVDTHHGQTLAQQWKVKKLPTTILVRIVKSGKARVVKRWERGAMTKEQLRTFVDPTAP